MIITFNVNPCYWIDLTYITGNENIVIYILLALIFILISFFLLLFFYIKFKKQTRIIQESEEKYRDLVENSGVGIIEVDLSGNTTYINNSFCKLYGYDYEEIINRPFGMLVYSEDLPMIIDYFKKRIKGEYAPNTSECRAVPKNGGIVNIHLTVIPLYKGVIL